MISKKNHPKIELQGWIKVDDADCLITQVYKPNAISGACEVVTNPQQPVNRDVLWDGNNWVFSTKPTFINAAGTSRLQSYVDKLKQGR